MSDCFDHDLDAFESMWDCRYGDRPDYHDCSSYGGSRESYYDTFQIKKIITQTEKAYLLELYEEELPFIGDKYFVREHTILVWVPKSIIRSMGIIADGEYVKIHVGILISCLKNCIPKQQEMREYPHKSTEDTGKNKEERRLTKEEREKISRKILGLQNRTSREDTLVVIIKRYEALLQSHNL